MKRSRILKLLCDLLIGATIILTSPWQPTPAFADTSAFVLGSVLTNQPVSFTGSRGWQFQAGSSEGEILITQLGVFDAGGDGLVNSHQVGLWRAGNITGTLLGSATVPAGTDAPLINGYRWVSIDPVLLPRTFALYVVAAQFSAGDPDDLVTPRPPGTAPGGFQFAPEVYPFLFAGRGAAGENLPYPAGFSSCGEGCTPEIFWEPNFRYVVVPEPSVWVLLLPGLFGLGLLFRRKSHL